MPGLTRLQSSVYLAIAAHLMSFVGPCSGTGLGPDLVTFASNANNCHDIGADIQTCHK